MAVKYSALTRTISQTDMKNFRHNPSYELSFWYTNGGGALSGAFLSFIPLVVINLIISEIGYGSFVMYLIIIATASLSGMIVMKFIRTGVDERLYRFVHFARENNFTYTARDDSKNEVGMIFQQGHSRYRKDSITGSAEAPFTIANYFYTTGSGKNQQSHDWGYVSIPLTRNVPNMVLDAKSNNTGIFGLNLTNLPSSLKKDQTLSLEGDFDTYFTLYAPKQYEQDALYIFTPDLMALLIDNTAKFDIETVDNRLYIYSSKQFNLSDQTVLEKIFAIINVIGKKTLSQTSRYADERVGDKTSNVIAEPGKRLKTSVTATVIFIAIIFVINIIGFIFSQ